MILEKLVLTQFRNYARLVWKPDALVTVFHGENGAGKTNLLEALSLLSPGRGLRGAPLPQMARFGADSWGVAATLSNRSGPCQLGVGYDSEAPRGRIVLIDGQRARSQADLAGIYPALWLTPQMDRLFTEGATGRRRFFDRLVLAHNPQHARELAAHETAVAQRNRLLVERPSEDAWLSALESSISRHAVAVTAERMVLVDAINHGEAYAPVFPLPRIALECAIAAELKSRPAIQVEDHLRSRLKASRMDDQQRRTTHHGAHRADYSLSDRHTGRLAQFSSSGQQKILLIGIILSHAQLVAAHQGVPPTLLLDEPLVHLDDMHRDAFLSAIEAMQAPAVMTGTDCMSFARLSEKVARICVSNDALTT